MSASVPGPAEPADRWFTGYGGIRLHAVDWGGPEAGTPILLLHGVGGNAWIWGDVAPRLRAALPDHRVVALDQRDGGLSEHPPEGYGRDAFAGDVAAVVAALGGRPVILVGHSRGGWLAAWIAAAHPGLVERLVLVDPARLVFASTGEADGFFTWVLGALGPFADAEAAVAWARAQDEAARWTPVRIRSFLAGLETAPDGRLVGRLPREVVPHLQAARVRGEEVSEALARITAPTLLFVAEHQAPARLADKLAYAERIPHARLVRLPGSHFLHVDEPEAVAHEIAAFVRG